MAKRRKTGWKGALTGALALLLIVGVDVGVVSSMTDSETQKVSSFSYSVGALDDDGIFKEYDQTIVSDYFECQGLTVTPEADASGTYEIFFYDENKSFLGKTDILSPADGVYEKPFGHWDSGIYLMAKYARIMITPAAPSTDAGEESFRIRFWEVSKYASTLSVATDKKQVFERAEKNRIFDDKDALSGYHWNDIASIEDGAAPYEGWTASPVIEIPEGTTTVELWFCFSSESDSLYARSAGEDGVLRESMIVTGEMVDLDFPYHKVMTVTDQKYLVIFYGGSPDVFMYAFSD